MPLMAANRARFKGKAVLDIGTGSGILALYAAELGATRVVATDIDPRAIACVEENAQRLGLASVVQARLVSPEEPSAYAVVRPGETFDIIVSTVPCLVNRKPSVVSGTLDDGIASDDFIRLGLSILSGLRDHLNQGGVAILLYKFAVMQNLMLGYARHMGYGVEHHPALRILPCDLHALYNSLAAEVARTEYLEARALLWPWPNASTEANGPGSEEFIQVNWLGDPGMAFPRLWDGTLDRALPGVVVVRKDAMPSEPPQQNASGPRDLPAQVPSAQSSMAPGPSTESAGSCHDYPSLLFKGPLRICRGTPWPAVAERDVTPIMEANRQKFEGKTVLDFGTGSGILALLAAQLGAAKVVAMDVEPRAIACVQENAKRLGLDSVIEARLVGPGDPSAFRPGELFDVVVAVPPHKVNRAPFVAPGSVDGGITPTDTIKLGLSLVRALAAHLHQDGAAVLLYESTVMHELVVSYASYLGYAVEHHPARLLSSSDWHVLYNSFAARVARTEHLPFSALLVPLRSDPEGLSGPAGLGGPGTFGPGGLTGPAHATGPIGPSERLGSPGAYLKLNYVNENQGKFPQLWEDDLNRIVPGLIVIRKRGAQPGQAPPHAPSHREAGAGP